MAADLHIHIFEGIAEKDLSGFFANTWGSKYFNLGKGSSWDDPSRKKVGDTPSVWVGEVSWLKAALFDDSEAFIPDPVGAISELVGEDLPVIDDSFMEKVKEAMAMPNETGYSLAHAEEILAFLEEHKGKQVFTISW